MASNEEITRIHTWVAEWSGTTVEECAYSREDIRNICRGPMRDFLLNFVTPRFRTDEQIKVLRSNLYLQDVNNQGSSDSGAEAFVNEEQTKGLKQQLEQVREEKTDALKLVLKNVEDVDTSKLELSTKLQQNLAVFEDLEASAHLVKNRVLSTNSLLQDVNAIKSEQELTSFIGVRGTAPSPQIGSVSMNDSMSPESVNPQMAQLYLLYQNAHDLFNQFFHQSYNGSSKQSSSLSPEMQTLSSTVSTQISDLIKSGVSPALIEKWAGLEEEKSSVDMRMMSSKISNVMSPLEELSEEVDTLYVKLMKAHVNIHYRKKDVEKKLNDLRDQNTIKIRDAILKDSSIVPADFLSFIQKEEMHKKLLKCRELARKLRYGTSPSEQDDILNFLCEEFSQTDETMNATREGSTTGDKGSIMSSLDGNSSFMKQQTLEDLSCALLKSFPQSRNQLGSTIDQCRGLVLDKFPQMNTLMNSGKKDNMQFPSENSLSSKERLPEMTTKDINIPPELLFNFNKMPTCSSYVDSDEQNILLGEAFKLHSELEKKRTQNEMRMSERAFNKLKD